MSFRVDQETLEALEWPQVVDLLREQCRTAQGRAWLAEAEKLVLQRSTALSPKQLTNWFTNN